MTPTTKAQRRALFKVFQRDFPNWETPFYRRDRYCMRIRVPSVQYRRFRGRVQPGFGMDCILVPWKGMWLGIEKDGYTHS